MSTLHIPSSRRKWFRDIDGVWSIDKDKDSTEPFKVDFFAALEDIASGETISAVATDPSGVTVNSATIVAGKNATNTAVSLSISDTDGSVELTLTTSSGYTLVQDLRFMGVPGPDRENDYR
jgi:hypothetical protein